MDHPILQSPPPVGPRVRTRTRRSARTPRDAPSGPERKTARPRRACNTTSQGAHSSSPAAHRRAPPVQAQRGDVPLAVTWRCSGPKAAAAGRAHGGVLRCGKTTVPRGAPKTSWVCPAPRPSTYCPATPADIRVCATLVPQRARPHCSLCALRFDAARGGAHRRGQPLGGAAAADLKHDVQ